MKIGATFAAIRENQGYTVKQISDFIHISEEELILFEMGEKTIGVSCLEEACNLFGCTLAALQGKEQLNLLPAIQNAHLMSANEMEMIRTVNKITLNLRYMKKLEGDKK